ncbi:MAG: aquaporin [Buchnera aphidicola (Floraphis choui)]
MSNVKKRIILLFQCISELLGTGLIAFFSSSYTAYSKLIYNFDNVLGFSFILGLSTCIAIYISLSMSEAHLNPIVTLSFFLLSKFNHKKVIPYIISQIFGSFFSSVITYKLYYDLLTNFEKHNRILRGSLESLNLASIFSFFPNKNLDVLEIFLLEIFVTFIFIFIIIILNDNEKLFSFKIATYSPILIGILIFLINIIISPLTNFTLNPAHDIGSHIFIYLSGWEKIAFTRGESVIYFVIPILGTILGSIMSVYFYKYIKIKFYRHKIK